MDKKFRDLKPGDVVFVANKKDWTLKPIKIIRVEEVSRINLIWIFLESGSNYLVDKMDSYYELLLNGIWTNQEEATKEMMRWAKEEEKRYIKDIDSLISEYEALINFMIEHGEKV